MVPSRDIIVIGASEGGLDAICSLTSGLPETLQAPVLIVLHTHQDGPGLLANVIGRCTPLPVSYGLQTAKIERGHVYFAPPGHHLTVFPPGYLALDQGPKENVTRPAADPLFRSAAALYGPRVIGVVLTGNGADGTAGLRAIKQAGGLIIVQDPGDAKARGMPYSALTHGRPDYRVPLAEIAPLLVCLVGGAGP